MECSRSQPCGAPKSAATEAELSGALRVLDLFSGIGGFSLGLERTGGFKTVRLCEIEDYCRRLLAARFPGVPCSPDVTNADFQEGEADVIVGGFPCQDLSNAGRRAGLSGARSGLYRHLVRAIRVVRPLRAVLENVAALLGRGMGTVLGDLAESGYDAEWDCLPASAVGAPHQRDRVWIVAHPGGEQHQGAGDAFRRALAEGLPEAFERNTGLPAGPDAKADAFDPDAHRLGSHRAEIDQLGGLELRHEQDGFPGSLGGPMANAGGQRDAGPREPVNAGHRSADREGQADDAQHGRFGPVWATEPDVGRVAHGVPARVDRLRGLGNAVVPQIPELIGRAILASLAQERAAA
jgi:DNA (cytosine-5)-methyltransferase 1